jgi:hypothetical protein
MRKGILKAGVKAGVVAATVAAATAMWVPTASAASYEQYITTYWGANAWTQCTNQGQSDIRNTSAFDYECDYTWRTIHGGFTQGGYELYEYFNIG